MTPAPRDDRPAAPRWASAAERGSRRGLHVLVWCFRHFGDAARPLLAPVALYYTLFAGEARRASASYLTRIDRARGGDGRRPRFRDRFRHFHTFANLIVDRVMFWAGAHDRFEVSYEGQEQLRRYLDEGRGVFMVGAHLGSFDVLRVAARDAEVPVNVLMYARNAEKINEVFEALDPGCRVRVIDLDPTSIRAAFEVRERVRRGECVAVLADRFRPGPRSRVARVNFLGEPAAFPLGPFLLPIVLGVPVFMMLALRTGPRSYRARMLPLLDGEPVARADREKAAREVAEAFASRLEQECLRYPFQWFNFYDFWSDSDRGV